MCEQFYLHQSATEIVNTDTIYQDLKLDDKLELRRQNKFWSCNCCRSSQTPRLQFLSTPIMKELEVEGHKILYPSEDNGDDSIEVSSNNLVLIPKNYKFGKIQQRNLTVNLFSNQEPTNRLISTLYNIRLSKFAQRKLYADLFEGEIVANQNNRLQSVNKVVDDSMIRSSVSWKHKRKNNIYSQFQQYGQAAIGYSMDVPVDNLESIITSKLCNGEVITLDFMGNESHEYSIVYRLHNHDNTVNCSDGCDTRIIVDSNERLEDKYIPVYIASLSQKHAQFVEQFLKNRNFTLFSEDYFCGIDFYLNGTGRINGLCWSYECIVFNEELSRSTFTGNELQMDDYLQYLENSILTSVNSIYIKNCLGVSEEEAMKIQGLAYKYQLDLSMKEEHLPLPSYETMFRRKPEPQSRSNIESSSVLLSLCKRILIQLSEEEKYSLTTEEYLEKIARMTKFAVIDDSRITAEVENTMISFILDEKLNELMNRYGCFVGHYTKIVHSFSFTISLSVSLSVSLSLCLSLSHILVNNFRNIACWSISLLLVPTPHRIFNCNEEVKSIRLLYKRI